MTRVSIGGVKGLVPNGRQVITRANANLYVWGHCSLVVPYGVKHFGQSWFKYWCDTMLDQAITETSPNLLLIKLSSTLWHQAKMADNLETAFQMNFHE